MTNPTIEISILFTVTSFGWDKPTGEVRRVAEFLINLEKEAYQKRGRQGNIFSRNQALG